MKQRENKIFVILFFVFGFALFLSLIITKALYNKTSKMKLINGRSSSIVEIDWEKLYPYDTEIDELPLEVKRVEKSKVDKVASSIRKLSNVGNEWAHNTAYYDMVAKTGYVINSFLKNPAVGNAYVKNRNGYMAYARSNKTSFEDAKESVVNYASLQKYLNSQDIDFLYFIAPSKACRVDMEFADGVVCYDNDNIDTCIEAMDFYGIKNVDLRKNIHADDMDHYSMYYKTDHHWKVETGLWVASQIAKELNERYGYSFNEAKDIGEYKMVTYPKAEFGSQGETVTHFVVKPEDMIVPYPEFETDYRLEIPNKGIDERGSFRELFVDEAGIDEVIKEGGGAAYGKILYGNPPYISITNYNNPNGPKVLMIRDSYASVVAPYFAASCSELVLLDTRIENGYFTGSIVNCINKFNPDIVVSLQCEPQQILLNKK